MGSHTRTCPFCEATCGLEVELDGARVVSVRGDEADVLSHGFLCPKAYGLKELHHDPDRLRTPLRRTPAGAFEPVGWDEAFAEIDSRLSPILERHGRNAVAAYVGNPNAHNLSSVLYLPALIKAIGTRNIFSASTVDQMPKQVAAGLMFGGGLSVPVPDVDRTDHLLVLGANPLASNGSLLTAPDMRGRIRAIRERGGKVVVVDPRRSRTAEHADEHHFIRPGTDAHLLLGVVHTLLDEDLAKSLGEHFNGADEVRGLAVEFTPELMAAECGIEAGEIRRMARELAAAERAAVYGRIGTTTQEFGTIASWLVDVVNVLTGNLDREGGAMFPRAAAGQRNAQGTQGRGKGVNLWRWTSRVREMPEVFGELPAACLAEEIDTPGDDQVRALLTVAGNPARSLPNSSRLEAAMDQLELMVSVDIYLNETTRHADFILPGSTPLAKSHYDLALYQLAVRNVANYSPPLMEDPDGIPDEWRTLLRLTGIAAGQGPDADTDAIDDFVTRTLIARELADPGSRLAGQDADEVLRSLEPRRGPERMLDFMLRAGPYDLTLDDLEASPHGLDLGPLEPRLPEVLRTPSGRVELAPQPIVQDLDRLRASIGRANGRLVLIGRRQLRSNNSWMHNLEPLVKGKERCTMHVNPADAGRLHLEDGALAKVSSRAGEIEAPVEVTDAIMPGVVSIPHGWGHDAEGAQMQVAAEHAGVNSNALADENLVDPLSGNAVLNGIPVEVAPVRAADAVPA